MSTRLSSPATISLSGLNLNYIDDAGTYWAFDKIAGWHDGPSTKVDQIDRINAPGQFAQNGHRGGKTITVDGWVAADTRAPVEAASSQLAATLASGGFDTFSFDDDDSGVKTATVQLLNLTIDWNDSRTFFRFQLQLLAPSAYRFGATSSASTGFAADAPGSGMVFDLFPDGVMDFGPLGDVGQVTVSNDGNAPADVKFTVTGPGPEGGFFILDIASGERITYLGALPAGSSLVLDGRNGTVVIDGTADRLGDTIVGAWPVIPAGESRSFVFESLGGSTAATLTAECVSTYW